MNVVLSRPLTGWHVTPTSNMSSVMESGLVPAIGPRSEKLGEPFPAVYLFVTREELDEALASWLGEELEDESLTVIRVRVPDDVEIASYAGFEFSVASRLGPDCFLETVDDYDRVSPVP